MNLHYTETGRTHKYKACDESGPSSITGWLKSTPLGNSGCRCLELLGSHAAVIMVHLLLRRLLIISICINDPCKNIKRITTVLFILHEKEQKFKNEERVARENQCINCLPGDTVLSVLAIFNSSKTLWVKSYLKAYELSVQITCYSNSEIFSFHLILWGLPQLVETNPETT